MRIYITGISGFLSINLVRHLLANGYEDITGIDLVDFTYPERDRIDFLQGDIRDREAVKCFGKILDSGTMPLNDNLSSEVFEDRGI